MREHTQAFTPALAVADLAVCAAMKCTSELAAVASELAAENGTLLASRGLLLRRTTQERDGLVLLVQSMDRD